MIKYINKLPQDSQKLADLGQGVSLPQNTNIDYSRVVVRKPWGKEYLLYQTADVAIWILKINCNAETSMHCHLNKKTSLIALEGAVSVSTLHETCSLKPADGVIISKGVFHQTKNIELTGATSWIMEIESPVNKHDLVRIGDKYGRVGFGYEDEKYFLNRNSNYNYLTRDPSAAYQNIQKRFNEVTVGLKIIESQVELDSLQLLHDDDAVSVVMGDTALRKKSGMVQRGEIISGATIKKLNGLVFHGIVEIVLIKKLDNY